MAKNYLMLLVHKKQRVNESFGKCWFSRLFISWLGFLQLNVLALSVCTREAYQWMKERNVDDWHIINLNRCSFICWWIMMGICEVCWLNHQKNISTITIMIVQDSLNPFHVKYLVNRKSTDGGINNTASSLTRRLLSSRVKQNKARHC